MERFQNPQRQVTIALVGKYIQLHDAYLSVVEALSHGGIAHRARVRIQWVASDDLVEPEQAAARLGDVQGILVPGGFGGRGTEGMLEAARYARERGVPYLGICLGMQMAVIEFARHVAGMEGANSTEFDPHTPYPVIHLMEDQEGLQQTGGTMRLGGYGCRLEGAASVGSLYPQADIVERHRHRYEFSNRYLD